MAKNINIGELSKKERAETGEVDEYTRGYIDAAQEKMKKELSDELKREISSRASKIAEKIKKDLQDYVSQNQTRIVEALAIFVVLFTFISVNIQIFTKTKDLFSATIFMILMTICSGILISFPLILLHANKSDKKPSWLWWVFAVSIILLLLVLVISHWINVPLNINQ